VPRQLPDITTSNCGMRCIFDYRGFCVNRCRCPCPIATRAEIGRPAPAEGEQPGGILIAAVLVPTGYDADSMANRK